MENKEKKKAGRQPKHSVDVVLNAVRGSAGIKSTIARKLNINICTLRSYIEKNPEIKEAIEEELESVLDMAESKLFQLIQSGDTTAIFFFLNNKGQCRGYNLPREKSDDRRTDVKLVLNLSGKGASAKKVGVNV